MTVEPDRMGIADRDTEGKAVAYLVAQGVEHTEDAQEKEHEAIARGLPPTMHAVIGSSTNRLAG